LCGPGSLAPLSFAIKPHIGNGSADSQSFGADKCPDLKSLQRRFRKLADLCQRQRRPPSLQTMGAPHFFCISADFDVAPRVILIASPNWHAPQEFFQGCRLEHHLFMGHGSSSARFGIEFRSTSFWPVDPHHRFQGTHTTVDNDGTETIEAARRLDNEADTIGEI